MKCPKCGYISFDFNQMCPKCNKNISAEQEKFNLPSFRPEPPSLLGFLTGDANESNVNLRSPSTSHIDMSRGSDMEERDSLMLDQDNLDLDEHDLELSFEPEALENYSIEQDSVLESEGLISDSDFSLEEKEDDEIFSSSLKEEDGSDLSLDLGDLSLEEPEQLSEDHAEIEVSPERTIQGLESEEDLSLDSMDDMSEDIDNDIGDIGSEIELDFEDLKISDIGDLELGSGLDSPVNMAEATFVDTEADTLDGEEDSDFSSMDELMDVEDQLPDISDLILKGDEPQKTETTMVIEGFSLDDAISSEKEESFEFSDIPLEDSPDLEEGAFDLEGLDLDANGSGEIEKTMILDNLSLNDSDDLEKSFDISDLSFD
jgi:hypothetical protein